MSRWIEKECEEDKQGSRSRTGNERGGEEEAFFEHVFSARFITQERSGVIGQPSQYEPVLVPHLFFSFPPEFCATIHVAMLDHPKSRFIVPVIFLLIIFF